MRAKSVQEKVAAGLPNLGSAPGTILELGEVHFVHGAGNNEAYWEAYQAGEARAALALEVGDSRLALGRRDDGDVDVVWKGTISYPGSDTAFLWDIPTLWGYRNLRLSETVYCGMQVDGAMSPYGMAYRWTVPGS